MTTVKVGDSIYDKDGFLGRIQEISNGVARVLWPENCMVDHVSVEEINGKDYEIAMMANPPIRKPGRLRMFLARLWASVRSTL